MRIRGVKPVRATRPMPVMPVQQAVPPPMPQPMAAPMAPPAMPSRSVVPGVNRPGRIYHGKGMGKFK